MRLRHSGAGCQTRELPHATRTGHRRIGPFQELGTERRSKRGVVGCRSIVGEHQCLTARRQESRDALSGNGETVDERGHGSASPISRISLVKSAMKRATPAATHNAANNQKRMITVVSGQPDNSK